MTLYVGSLCNILVEYRLESIAGLNSEIFKTMFASLKSRDPKINMDAGGGEGTLCVHHRWVRLGSKTRRLPTAHKHLSTLITTGDLKITLNRSI